MIDNFFRNSGMCAEDPFENGRYLILWSSNSNTYFVRPSSRLKAEETPAFFWIETRPSHYHSKTLRQSLRLARPGPARKEVRGGCARQTRKRCLGVVTVRSSRMHSLCAEPLRWTATGLLEAEKKFRRIKGYQEILLLKERLNPSRIQQKEVRAVEVA